MLIGASGSYDVYGSLDLFSGPSSIGPSGSLVIGTGTGDLFGIDFNPALSPVGGLAVPEGYSSGSLLSGSATFSGETFASLSLTPGNYTWTWGSGASADSFTLNIGLVPEPSTALLVLTGLVPMAMRRRRLG